MIAVKVRTAMAAPPLGASISRSRSSFGRMLHSILTSEYRSLPGCRGTGIRTYDDRPRRGRAPHGAVDRATLCARAADRGAGGDGVGEDDAGAADRAPAGSAARRARRAALGAELDDGADRGVPRPG